MTKRTCLCAFAAATLLPAHPMGNFSVNHYAKLQVSANGVEMRYVLDLAEIPTFELLRDWKLDAHSPQPELARKAAAQAKTWMQNLEFRSDGQPLRPRFVGAELAIAEGSGGLPIGRITTRLHLPAVPGRLAYEDHNYPGRAGWKEIVIASGAGAALERASQGDRDQSKELTAYPVDPAFAPPQDLRAALEWRIDPPARLLAQREPTPASQPAAPAIHAPDRGPRPAKAAPGTVVRGDFLSTLLSKRDLSLSAIIIGLLVAFA
ncbi:MAG: hypothetical protein ACRD9L_20435, partial [Bryobacteraceae bacterium]